MKINEAVKIIMRDMCGYNDCSFAEAFLCAAYSSAEDLEKEGVILDTEVMRKAVSSIISKNADVTQALVHARLQSAGEAKQLAMINGFDLIPVIHSACSLCETPINNFSVALAVVNTDFEAPKFGEAIDWILTTGHDVPKEVREEMIKTVDCALASMGVKPQIGKKGEVFYEANDITAALSSNTLH